jgi:N-acetylglucosaminyl-diphospho-decaprenol L-rhamnosyltransferase
MRLLMPRLSIVVVTYNSRPDLEGCLASLTGTHAPRVDHEIVIVDNASSDDTVAYVRGRWPGVRVIEAGANLGFAAGNNVGIRQTSGELVLLLNPDTIADAGAIDMLVATLDAQPHAAIVGPRITDADGRAELSFGRMISPLAEVLQKLLVVGSDRQWPVVAPLVERMTRRPQAVDWVSGACLLARRQDVEAAGLLDERFFMYTEDVDLCASVRARGRAVLFEPSARIVHLRGRSRASVRPAADTAYRRSQLAFYEKHHPAWTPLLRIYLRGRGKI